MESFTRERVESKRDNYNIDMCFNQQVPAINCMGRRWKNSNQRVEVIGMGSVARNADRSTFTEPNDVF
jgi:hypothetical protein